MITKEQKQKIIELFTEGEPKTHIAKKTGISKPTVYSVIEEFQKSIKSDKTRETKYGFVLTEDQNKRLSIIATLFETDENELIDIFLKVWRELYDHRIATNSDVDFLSLLADSVDITFIAKRKGFNVGSILQSLKDMEDQGIEPKDLNEAIKTLNELETFDNMMHNIGNQINGKERELNSIKLEIDKLTEEKEELESDITIKNRELEKVSKDHKYFVDNRDMYMDEFLKVAEANIKDELASLKNQVKQERLKLNNVIANTNTVKENLKNYENYNKFYNKLESGDMDAQIGFLKMCISLLKLGDFVDKNLADLINSRLENMKNRTNPKTIF